MSGDKYGPSTRLLGRSWPVTPNDVFDVVDPMTGKPACARGIYVGASGSLVIITADNDDAHPVTIAAAAAGQYFPWSVRRVLATGTTATGIVAFA